MSLVESALNTIQTERIQQLESQLKAALDKQGDFTLQLSALQADKYRLDFYKKAIDEFRDSVLNERVHIAENGMTNDQINDVLNNFDEYFVYGLDPLDAAMKGQG